MLLAHSAKLEDGVSVHGYAAHIGGTVSRALKAAKEVARFSLVDGDLLLGAVHHSAEYHDLGKLDDENQAVLAGEQQAGRLPVQHTDAGTAHHRAASPLVRSRTRSPPRSGPMARTSRASS